MERRKEQKLRSLYRLRGETRMKCYSFFDKIECVHCGENDLIVLEFDHIDRKTKTMNIALMINSRIKWELIEEELKKCQLLCANCHKRKTLSEQKAWAFM